ncbi:abortive infection system antitoxin AbiGi family protein [Vibrio rotiferianus]|uniref:abortive infection system antitoxin AbiGi family protein n=1 Tax=Vibrio rotiferianus TaxID=190895 RepID=UPI00406A7B03
MGVSSNSVIHFTNSLDAIKGILKNNFRPKYCREYTLLDECYSDILVPMVSFCDIPMSDIKEHIDKYGCYGVGLSKKWARTSGLNPVLYIDSNSHLNRSLEYVIRNFVANSNEDKTPLHELDNDKLRMVDIVRYVKNYQEDLIRKSETIPDYRFYDEREWRFVPEFSDEFRACFDNTCIGDFKDEFEQSAKNLSKVRLMFNPEDINYLIIKEDREIHELIRFLKDDMGNEYSYKTIERLTTRILTTDQIRGDF